MIDQVTARRLGTLERLLEQSVELIQELEARQALQEAQIMQLNQRLLDCEKGTPVVRLKGRVAR